MLITKAKIPMPDPLVRPEAWADDGDGGRRAEVEGYHLWVERIRLSRDVWLPTIWTHDAALPIVRVPVALIRRPTYRTPDAIMGPASVEEGQALAVDLLRAWLRARDEATRAAYEALPAPAREELSARRAHWAPPLAARTACGGPLTWMSWTRYPDATLGYLPDDVCPVCRAAALVDRAAALEAAARAARGEADQVTRTPRRDGGSWSRHAEAAIKATGNRYLTGRLWQETKYGGDRS